MQPYIWALDGATQVVMQPHICMLDIATYGGNVATDMHARWCHTGGNAATNSFAI